MTNNYVGYLFGKSSKILYSYKIATFRCAVCDKTVDVPFTGRKKVENPTHCGYKTIDTGVIKRNVPRK